MNGIEPFSHISVDIAVFVIGGNSLCKIFRRLYGKHCITGFMVYLEFISAPVIYLHKVAAGHIETFCCFAVIFEFIVEVTYFHTVVPYLNFFAKEVVAEILAVHEHIDKLTLTGIFQANHARKVKTKLIADYLFIVFEDYPGFVFSHSENICLFFHFELVGSLNSGFGTPGTVTTTLYFHCSFFLFVIFFTYKAYPAGFFVFQFRKYIKADITKTFYIVSGIGIHGFYGPPLFVNHKRKSWECRLHGA